MTVITKTESVSAVTFPDVPAGKGFLPKILAAVAEKQINIDMISQTPPRSDRFSFAFSISDDDIPALLNVTKDIKGSFDITPLISSGNVKLTVKDEIMQSTSGFAAKVFSAAEETGADTLITTTALDEISLLVPESSSEELAKKLSAL